MNAKKARALRRQVIALNLKPRAYEWKGQRPSPANPRANTHSVIVGTECARAVYQRMKRAIAQVGKGGNG